MLRGTIALLIASLIAPVPAIAADHRPLVITLDKAELLRLDQPARRIIVGNPAIADVTAESPGLIAVFARSVGETNLMVLGDNDKPLLSRRLVVTSGTLSVHLPPGNTPASRDYSCVEHRCLRVAPVEAAAGGGASGVPTTLPPLGPAAAAASTGKP